MALSTYADLLAHIANQLDRSDLSTQIADAVIMFESLCNYGDDDMSFDALRCRQMETKSTGNSMDADGEFTIATDYLEMLRVRYNSDPYGPLSYVPPKELDAMYGTATSGTPRFYTIEGSKVRIRPTGSSTVDYAYYQAIPALSSAVNWLYTARPQAYVFGTLHYVYIFLEDPEAALAMLTLTKSLIKGLRDSSKMNQDGALAMRSASQAW